MFSEGQYLEKLPVQIIYPCSLLVSLYPARNIDILMTYLEMYQLYHTLFASNTAMRLHPNHLFSQTNVNSFV